MAANLFSVLIFCLTFLSYQVEGTCPFGRWGKDCHRQCSSRCIGRWCEVSSGKCKLGCADRFYGDRCEQHCWNCGGFGRCYRDGRCIYSCLAGWARPFCFNIRRGRTLYGDRVTYRCVSGYTGVGSGTSTCQKNGTWSRPGLVCNKNDCGQPTPFANMVISGGRTLYGDRVTYRCVSGYTGVGTGTSTCQENGTWTRPGLVCNKNDCGQPTPFANMVISGGRTLYGDRVTYRCVSGYTGVGTGTSTCQENGTWTRPGLVCNKNDCGQPTPFANMVVSGGRTLYRDRVTYRCVSGYTGVGSGTSTCQENGTWTRPGLVCNKNDCGQPTPFTNMVVSGGRTLYGDRVTYRCVSGYTGVGSGTSICQENGTWTRPGLVCNKASCKDDYSFCQESLIDCEAPGISQACKKTCGACGDTHAEPCDDPERWGWHCNDLCNTACRERRCDRVSGHCLGECVVGRYGSACELRCENCDGGGCFKNGTCRTGCRNRWRGPRCDQSD